MTNLGLGYLDVKFSIIRSTINAKNKSAKKEEKDNFSGRY